MRGGQPMYSSQGELEPLIMRLMENADLVAALEKRGADPTRTLCLPRTIGRYFADKVDVENHRIVRADCFNIAGEGVLGVLPSSNIYARPIEGLAVLYDLTADKIIDISDTRADNSAAA